MRKVYFGKSLYHSATSNELYHHGILGMKWGVRRYQNTDGSYKPSAEGRYDPDDSSSSHDSSNNKADTDSFLKSIKKSKTQLFDRDGSKAKHWKDKASEVVKRDYEANKDKFLNSNEFKNYKQIEATHNKMNSKKYEDAERNLHKLIDDHVEKKFSGSKASWGDKLTYKEQLSKVINNAIDDERVKQVRQDIEKYGRTGIDKSKEFKNWCKREDIDYKNIPDQEYKNYLKEDFMETYQQW